MFKSTNVALLFKSTLPSRIFRAVCIDAVTGRELGRKLFVSVLACERPSVTLGDIAELVGEVNEDVIAKVDISALPAVNESFSEFPHRGNGATPVRETVRSNLYDRAKAASYVRWNPTSPGPSGIDGNSRRRQLAPAGTCDQTATSETVAHTDMGAGAD